MLGPPYRCRSNMANTRQTRPVSSLGFQVKVLKTFQVCPSSLKSGGAALTRCRCRRRAGEAQSRGRHQACSRPWRDRPVGEAQRSPGLHAYHHQRVYKHRKGVTRGKGRSRHMRMRWWNVYLPANTMAGTSRGFSGRRFRGGESGDDGTELPSLREFRTDAMLRTNMLWVHF